jgi:hypothetical protein
MGRRVKLGKRRSVSEEGLAWRLCAAVLSEQLGVTMKYWQSANPRRPEGVGAYWFEQVRLLGRDRVEEIIAEARRRPGRYRAGHGGELTVDQFLRETEPPEE